MTFGLAAAGIISKRDAMIANSVLNIVIGIILLFTPAIVVGAGMIGAGVGGLLLGGMFELYGDSFELGWTIGTILGSIIGSKLGEAAVKYVLPALSKTLSTTDDAINAVDDVARAADDGLGNLNWNGRESHVKLHEMANPNKKVHGVFNGNSYSMTNQAWSARAGVSPVPDPRGINSIYRIPHLNAGVGGGMLQNGVQLNYISIVVKPNTNILITAFPSL